MRRVTVRTSDLAHYSELRIERTALRLEHMSGRLNRSAKIGIDCAAGRASVAPGARTDRRLSAARFAMDLERHKFHGRPTRGLSERCERTAGI